MKARRFGGMCQSVFFKKLSSLIKAIVHLKYLFFENNYKLIYIMDTSSNRRTKRVKDIITVAARLPHQLKLCNLDPLKY